ncbi:MAG: hypothetical protein HC800_20290 [Phormidesmis sp. RL_2_1]|nr:hypothetical protein [Phormidesmis sp. RL_2_1]
MIKNNETVVEQDKYSDLWGDITTEREATLWGGASEASALTRVRPSLWR